MGEAVLPNHGSPESYRKSVEKLINRYKATDEAVNYKELSGEQSKAAVSRNLKFFYDSGLLECPKQGNYVPKEQLYDLIKKPGAAKEEAKDDVAEKLKEANDAFKEIDIRLSMNGGEGIQKSNLIEGVLEGVPLDVDERQNVKRLINVLTELELLTEAEEGLIKRNYKKDSSEMEETEKNLEKVSEGYKESNPQQNEQKNIEKEIGSGISLEISMDITDMGSEEIKEKIEIFEEKLR